VYTHSRTNLNSDVMRKVELGGYADHERVKLVKVGCESENVVFL
jgi:hypothetical protein